MTLLAAIPAFQILADNEQPPFAAFAFIGVIACGAFLVGLAIQALICYFVVQLFKRVPEQYRQQQPNMVWLLLIPLFNLVWSFFVYPKLSKSYELWAQATGQTEIGNAYGGLALALCICYACCIIPYLGSCAALAVLIILIVYLVQMNGLAAKIQGGAGLPPTPTNP